MDGKPPFKWVGGKTQLLPHLRPRVEAWRAVNPTGTYYEPFVGGGALFFDTMARDAADLSRPNLRAALGDANVRLIRTYRAIQHYPRDLIAALSVMPFDPDFYYATRARDIDACVSNVEVGAWLIYMMKCCFNGLYRVNKKGQHNVSMGTFAKPPLICDAPRIYACSHALRGVDLFAGGFFDAVAAAQRGDFVYFDPPYVPLSATSAFTSYDADGFTHAHQIALRDCALDLADRGVTVLLSNSSAPAIAELYGADFNIEHVSARRALNSDTTKRGAIQEALITPKANL